MIIKLLLPGGLAFIMFSIGLTLLVDDFARVFHRPGIMALGLACQIILLPLAAFALLTLWPIEPVLAVGVMILAASPGGVTSNLLTHMARGDTALSISLTAISSLAGVVTVPVIVQLALLHFMEMPAGGDLPVWRMVAGVFAVSTLPVAAGMAINHLNGAAADRIERFARPLSIGVFALIVIGAFASQWSSMMANLPKIGALMLALNTAVMATGFLLAHGLRAGRPGAVAIALEGGLQNGALGIFVAVTLLGNTAMAVPSITYALIMNVTAAAFIAVLLGAKAKALPREP